MAREARKSGRVIRNLLFGKRRYVFRVLFEVDGAERVVWILPIRRGVRADLKPSELAQPGEWKE